MATSDLYFLPILARALEQPRTQLALRAAFAEIMQLGRRPDHAHGFSQFCRFMAAVRAASERYRLTEQDVITEALFDLSLADEKERHVGVELLRSPDGLREYEELRAELSIMESQSPVPSVRLVRGQHIVGTAAFDERNLSASFAGIVPGNYELILDTGRVLWAAELMVQDCLWAAAYPGEPLRLAAVTVGVPLSPKWEMVLLEGELILRLYPGIEAGRLELEWRRPHPPRHIEG